MSYIPFNLNVEKLKIKFKILVDEVLMNLSLLETYDAFLGFEHRKSRILIKMYQ